MRFEVLPGLPPYGPMAVSFSKSGGQEHREGLVVRFFPGKSEPWVGNFIGGTTGCNIVLDHPNETYIIVVAQGEAFIVDPERRAVLDRMRIDIKQVISLTPLGSVVFQGLTDFSAIRADGSSWRSPRISWDGFRNVKVRETELSGEAYTPIMDAWVPFKLDLLTGHCTDGIYEKEIATATLVSRGKETKNSRGAD